MFPVVFLSADGKISRPGRFFCWLKWKERPKVCPCTGKRREPLVGILSFTYENQKLWKTLLNITKTLRFDESVVYQIDIEGVVIVREVYEISVV